MFSHTKLARSTLLRALYLLKLCL
ncbi:hypothetical protein MCP1_4340001 [Candidatus Terasakiella magnetica]|nr:hypothetical protein MCP1_4340001 [Candidatus Terasakiella magnetica]